MKPDYRKSLDEVFEDFAKRCFRYSREPLQILHFCGQRHPVDPLDMPSWSPDWRLGGPYYAVLGGTNSLEAFKAGKGLSCLAFGARITNIPKTIALKGVFIEDIYCAIGGFPDDPVPPSPVRQFAAIGSSLALSRLPNEYFNGRTFHSAVAHTLVVEDRVPLFLPDDQREDDILSQLPEQAQTYFDQAFGAIKLHFRPSLQTLSAYLTSAAAALHQRAFFLTKGGLMGIGPRSMKPRDKIYIFGDAETPFVLRPEKNGLAVVGECYVHGMMDGIIARAVENRTMKEEPVMLV